TDAEHGEEAEVVLEPVARRLPRHLRDRDRPADVADGNQAHQHLFHRIKYEHTVFPGFRDRLRQRGERRVADVALHLWWQRRQAYLRTDVTLAVTVRIQFRLTVRVETHRGRQRQRHVFAVAQHGDLQRALGMRLYDFEPVRPVAHRNAVGTDDQVVILQTGILRAPVGQDLAKARGNELVEGRHAERAEQVGFFAAGKPAVQRDRVRTLFTVGTLYAHLECTGFTEAVEQAHAHVLPGCDG